MDVLFSFAALGISSVMLLLVNRGELRAYVLISMSLGFVVTHWLIGQTVYQAAYNQFRLLGKGLEWCEKRVITPTFKGVMKAWTKAKDWLIPNPPDDHTIEPT